MTDLGEIHYILGMTIERNVDGKWLVIHQKQYVHNVSMDFLKLTLLPLQQMPTYS